MEWVVFSGMNRATEVENDDEGIFFTCRPVASVVGMKTAMAAQRSFRALFAANGETALTRRVHDSNRFLSLDPTS